MVSWLWVSNVGRLFHVVLTHLRTVTHPELGVTVQLPIISVKKNPQNPLYTQLGVLSKGTVLEVNVSELGLTVSL